MPLTLQNPQKSIDEIIVFLQTTLQKSGKKKLIVAVSGGIDSALALTMAVKAVGTENVYAILLPYKEQSTTDSQTIIHFNNVPTANVHEINIAGMVNQIANDLGTTDPLQLGNSMARVRMIVVYDLAKQLDGLVCGTENKSEKYLGYFTRFGDEASDIEPLQHLYKTQVRQLVEYLQMPAVFLEKAPSAGLWQNQTDETELGFSYREADKALVEIVDGEVVGADSAVKERVAARVKSQHFKQEVPYSLKSRMS